MAGQEHRSVQLPGRFLQPVYVDRRHFEKLKALQGTSEAAQLPSLQCVLELNWRRFLRFAGSGRVSRTSTRPQTRRFLDERSNARLHVIYCKTRYKHMELTKRFDMQSSNGWIQLTR